MQSNTKASLIVPILHQSLFLQINLRDYILTFPCPAALHNTVSRWHKNTDKFRVQFSYSEYVRAKVEATKYNVQTHHPVLSPGQNVFKCYSTAFYFLCKLRFCSASYVFADHARPVGCFSILCFCFNYIKFN